MKVLVFGGSGKIGSAVAWDLAKDDEVQAIGIVEPAGAGFPAPCRAAICAI